MKKLLLLLFFFAFIQFKVSAQTESTLKTWYEKAMMLQNQGDYKEAINWYSKIIQAGNYELSYFNRAECYFQIEELDKGMEDLRSETKAHPEYSRAWAKLGLNTFLYLDTLGGMNEIRKAVAIDSLDYYGWMTGGILFAFKNQKDSMLAWNNKMLDLLTDSSDIILINAYYELFDSLKFPVVAKEAARIQKEYNNNYIYYLLSNDYYRVVFYYAAAGEGLNTIKAVEMMYETEKLLPKPRKQKLYYAFNYFNLLGLQIYESGNYEDGKIILDYQFEIAGIINENSIYARAWSNKAYVYYQEVKYDTALLCYRQALDYYSKEVFDSSITVAYSTVGLIYTYQGKYDSAAYFIQLALKVCGKNDLTTKSICINNLGMYHMKTGNYQEAEKDYLEATEYAVTLKDTVNLTLFYNNLGNIYQSKAEYNVAEKYFLKALELNGENHPLLATIYSNLGYLHIMWGNFPTAVDYCNKALQEAISNKLTDRIGMIYNNLSLCYRNAGNYAEAAKVLRESIRISRELKSPDIEALGYNNLALVFSETENYDSARYYMKAALQINLALNKIDELGLNYDNIGTAFLQTDEYDSALFYIKMAVTYDSLLNRKERLASHYSNLGVVYLSKKEYADAENCLKKTIGILEEIRKTATGVVRREYLSQVIFNYQLLSFVQSNLKHYDDAFQTMELSKAKLLGEQLSGNNEFKPVTLKEVQQKLDDSTGIYFFSSMINNEGLGLFVNKKSITPIDFNTDTLFQLYNHLMGKKEDEAVSLENILNEYRNLLLIPKVASRSSALIEEQHLTVSPEMREKLSKLLYHYFFDDMQERLKSCRTLIIVPDGAINFLPFESLLDSNNRYLVEKVDVGYVQSMSIEHAISNRIYNGKRKPMLAFGGAVYMANNKQVVNTKTGKEAATKAAAEAVAARGPLTDSYNNLGYGSWANLPGTKTEVEKLKKMMPQSDVYEGNEVNEKNIKAMSVSGQLAQYRVIHFATHGMVVPEVPELSALVLSQNQSNTEEDNYLRADEISKLKMHADFVALSACETGLGKVYKGDGVVGLTQSFMIAGANSLAVSLWQVADASTSQFMTGIYESTDATSNYLKAINKMKRQFISGAYGNNYMAPYFWAPFVYYGKMR